LIIPKDLQRAVRKQRRGVPEFLGKFTGKGPGQKKKEKEDLEKKLKDLGDPAEISAMRKKIEALNDKSWGVW